MGIRTTRVGVLSQSPPSTYTSNTKQLTSRIVNTTATPVYIGGSSVDIIPNNRIFTSPFNNIFG